MEAMMVYHIIKTQIKYKAEVPDAICQTNYSQCQQCHALENG